MPVLFKEYPSLKGKVPWIPILTNIPTPIDKLENLKRKLNLTDEGEIYIKRDDKDHDIYGGNKLRKFEFIFGEAFENGKKGIMTFGGVGTNHGLACAIVAQNMNPPLKCDLFLAPQPLTWHVQRSLLLYDYFGAKLHTAGSYFTLALKGLFFKIFHPKHLLMLPGGSLLLGKGSPLGTVGFINAFFELNKQVENGIIDKPDVIFVAGGSTGTAAGLIAGAKLLKKDIEFRVIAVSDEMFVNTGSIIKNCNKTLDYLQQLDDTIPKVKVDDNDFEVIYGYLGSEYGVKTKRGQAAVDLVMELEGKQLGFKLETTYTGKAMAGMLDYLKEPENKSKKVLFWNTYNSNSLDKYLKDTEFNYKKLPKKLHKYYEKAQFQCWQIMGCSKEKREKCKAYLNHEYRFWKIVDCSLSEEKQEKARKQIKQSVKLEDS